MGQSGYCIYGKRLERGRFSVPQTDAVADFARLLLVLEGIDLAGSRQRKRFSLNKVA